jgi:iron complex outermembrane receptor protein
MASGMVNWFGDGNYYVGNLDLKPEVAHTVSVSAGWHDPNRSRWEAKVTPYYTYVQDYIGVDKIGSATYGGSTFNKLMFANHDAQLYGLDLSGRVAVWDSPDWGRTDLKGVVGWLHGETVATGNSLYHMMPLNGRVTLEHTLGGWTSAIEVVAVDAKTDVDPLRREPTTPSYALLNLRTGYGWRNIRFDLGIDNVFDKKYDLPLGGVNFDDYMASGWSGQIQPLAGPGRSFMTGMTVTF